MSKLTYISLFSSAGVGCYGFKTEGFECVATNEQLPKSEMFRIVRTPEETVCVDTTGKVRGHGAYLKKDKTVTMNAKKKKVLDRYLEVQVPDTIYDELLKLLNAKEIELAAFEDVCFKVPYI